MNTGDGAVGHTVLPAEHGSVSIARRFVTSWACDQGLDGACDDLALVVSELVTNAIEHGTGPVDVAVRRHDTDMQLEVTTALTPGWAERLNPSPTTSSGRGLQIVDALSSAWGHRDDERRRTVWARLPS